MKISTVELDTQPLESVTNTVYSVLTVVDVTGLAELGSLRSDEGNQVKLVPLIDVGAPPRLACVNMEILCVGPAFASGNGFMVTITVSKSKQIATDEVANNTYVFVPTGGITLVVTVVAIVFVGASCVQL